MLGNPFFIEPFNNSILAVTSVFSKFEIIVHELAVIDETTRGQDIDYFSNLRRARSLSFQLGNESFPGGVTFGDGRQSAF